MLSPTSIDAYYGLTTGGAILSRTIHHTQFDMHTCSQIRVSNGKNNLPSHWIAERILRMISNVDTRRPEQAIHYAFSTFNLYK